MGVIISIQRDTMRWQHSFCPYSKITRKVHPQEFNESWISKRKVLTNILLVDRNLVQLDFDWAAASKTGTQSTVFITLHQWYHYLWSFWILLKVLLVLKFISRYWKYGTILILLKFLNNYCCFGVPFWNIKTDNSQEQVTSLQLEV